MRSYKAINNQVFSNGNYSIVPIRMEDRNDIMNWRNEQIYHLRQSRLLTVEDQESYFQNVIEKQFNENQPNQILFSYLEKGRCIGYGGLVHINWIDKNAEISFVFDTALEDDFVTHWCIFLYLVEQVGFLELKFNKLFTFAFDLRPLLYIALQNSNYTKEATLKSHTFFNNQFIDVVIHSKLRENKLSLREAETNQDALQLFEWANDEEVRKNSLNSNKISIIDHFIWFQNKSATTKIYFLIDEYSTAIGQIRVDKINDYYEIDYSISKSYRGKGFGNKILELLISQMGNVNLLAKIKKTNLPSIKVFINNGFKLYNEENELIIYRKNS
jgi:RimJ/RimL family protein N-acetyltransferase